jgi:hypothetical protein
LGWGGWRLPSPFGCLSSQHALVLRDGDEDEEPSLGLRDADEDEEPSFVILDAIEEDFHRVTKVARLKTKGLQMEG